MRQIRGLKEGAKAYENDREVLETLGQRLAAERLRNNWTQTHLAEVAGVSRATVQRLEQGESTQLTNLVRILRALDLVRNLDALVPATSVSPLEMWRSDRSLRQRASTKPVEAPSSPWQWGEDQ
ncbi:MAG: helix-turn-helix transcriptional regulator [Planctomycetota bacterium]|nr:helix-turn-helix transcriptional regulator [Planctomycetota bacterium]